MAAKRDRSIRVRSYNVGFGDCLLVRIPVKSKRYWMLIDFGNAPGRAGSNTMFPEIAKDIKKETGGRIDVVVMTHEHLDHMEGFYSQKRVFDKLDVRNVWMSLPSHPSYYRDYPKARVHKRLKAAGHALLRSLSARGLALAPSFDRMLRNNLSNKDRIDYVRGLGKAHYLARGGRYVKKRKSKPPGLPGVGIRVLAPERDVSVYYQGSAMHNARGFAAVKGAASNTRRDPWQFWNVPRAPRQVPENLSRTDWERLRGRIQTGAVQFAQAIDKAQNNTSLVFELRVGKKRLLFPGDAELESWAQMRAANVRLGPVDFLKVSHHGSHNGTPADRLDDLLPKRRKKSAAILVSTKSRVYGTKHPVPDKSLLKELRARGRVYNTDKSDKLWVDVHV